MASVLALAGIGKDYGDRRAVDAVDLEIEAGTIVGLLGPNGAGKSTTFRMLCGLLPPSSGRAVVAGVDLGRAPAAGAMIARVPAASRPSSATAWSNCRKPR